MLAKLIIGNCTELLAARRAEEMGGPKAVDLTFLDPPFNQGKEYRGHNDVLPESYWEWMKQVCGPRTRSPLRAAPSTSCSGKDAERVLCCLPRESVERSRTYWSG